MICSWCSKGAIVAARASTRPSAVQSRSLNALSKRTFASFTPLRPTLQPSTFRSSLPAVNATPVMSSGPVTESTLDLLPKISSHPALGGTQVRCGPRNTFNPSHFVRKRRHGFLSRIRTRKGRAILQRRKLKRRSTLSH